MAKNNPIRNIAFIDGQNLHKGTQEVGFVADYKNLRIYLKEKYKVDEAYYFFGAICEKYQDKYDFLQKAGYILSFREHSPNLKGTKKGNVDCDIVFSAMKRLVEKEKFGKIIIVSGDGDYKKLVSFLIKKGKLEKILFPNSKFSSSLYEKIGGEFYDSLDKKDVKAKIIDKKVPIKKKKAP